MDFVFERKAGGKAAASLCTARREVQRAGDQQGDWCCHIMRSSLPLGLGGLVSAGLAGQGDDETEGF